MSSAGFPLPALAISNTSALGCARACRHRFVPQSLHRSRAEDDPAVDHVAKRGGDGVPGLAGGDVSAHARLQRPTDLRGVFLG